MKINRALIAILFLAGIFAIPVRGELNYNQLYVAGPAVTGNWEADQAKAMVPIGNNCFLWDGWLNTGQFKFINVSGTWDNNSIVADAPDLEFETWVSYNLVDNTANNHYDFKFVNKTAGYVRIIVDLGNLKVNFRRPILGIIGEAAYGWGNVNNFIPVFADDDGNVEWEGFLNSGEMKFLAGDCNNWTPCYNAPTQGDQFTNGGHGMSFNDGGGSVADNKYRVPVQGYYTLTFKRDNDQSPFHGVDVMVSIYPQVYVGGPAVTGDWDANKAHEMVPLGNDCFLWDGWLNEGRFKFIHTLGDWDNSSIVADSEDLRFDTGKKYTIFDHSKGKHSDFKFYNTKAGFVRMVLDFHSMKVNFRRPVLGMVGGAALGWGYPDPGQTIIPVFADDNGNVEWEGELKEGDLKFLAGDCSGWSPCYNAPSAGDQLSVGGHQMVYNDGQGSVVDYKYAVPATAYYMLKFKRDNQQSNFYGVDVSYKIYNNLYIGGAATPDNWNENLVDEMSQLGDGCFLWDGWLNTGEFKFLSARGDWVGSSVVSGTKDCEVSPNVSYALVDKVKKNYFDYKFVNPTAGFVRIVVDTHKMRVNLRRPVLAIVGDAALGWGSPDPGRKIIPIFADDNGGVTWQGQLRQGELKFLAGDCNAWTPCYNPSTNGDQLAPGGHEMKLNYPGDNHYKVPVSGYYTLTFKRDNPQSDFFGVDVATEEAPSLDGAFFGDAGRYIVGLDYAAQRVHMAPVPETLYIGVSGDNCQQLNRTAEGRFSADVQLSAGQYYKLASDPDDWGNSALSPNTDVNITAATANVAPMHGYSYTVPSDGKYLVTADFSGPAPSLKAVKQTTSLVEVVRSAANAAVVRVVDDEIIVEGDYASLEIYDVAGRMVGGESPCRVPGGVYLVKVDNTIHKISVR